MDEFYTLLLAAQTEKEENRRITSGLKAIELCVSRVWDNKLLEMAGDRTLPQDVRNEAANRIIDKCIAKGWYRDLLEMYDNKKLLRACRKAAKRAANVAALKVIEECKEKGNYMPLVRVALNRRLPKAVRKKADMTVNDIIHKHQDAPAKLAALPGHDELVKPGREFLHGLNKNNKPTLRDRIKHLFLAR